jgi:S1-C subfamily serine protease
MDDTHDDVPDDQAPSGEFPVGRPMSWADAPPPPPWPSDGWYHDPPAGGRPWGAPPLPARRRGSVSAAATVALVVVAVIAGLVVGRSLPNSTASTGPSNSGAFGAGGPGGGLAPATTPSGASGSSSATVAEIAAKVDSSLVDIDTELGYQNMAAAGTGIVLSANGLVLTNNHVINGSTAIRVTDIGNRKVYLGTVVGYDESSDVAVIQLHRASGLAVSTLGDSTTATVGQQVVAIGNAGGAGGTPAAAGGSVTALGQSITASDAGDGTSEQLRGLIQTDADIQPGDSGGALVNARGMVLGVDTAASSGFSFSNGGSEEGFAIPINAAKVLAGQIVAGHQSQLVHVGPTAFLGVSFSAQSGGGLNDTVYAVIKGTAAMQAGIAAGDVITNFGGTVVKAPGDLTRALVGYQPGDHVVVAWRTAAGTSRQADVTLTMGPNA